MRMGFFPCTLVAAAAMAAPAPQPAMDALLRRHFKADAPGAVVVVLKDGRTLFRRAYGLADLEARTPMTVERGFRIGSITKTFTAAAVLRLAEEGRLELGDPIRRHLPDLPEAWDPVTVLHLLNQTSGIPSYTDDPSWWPRQGEDLSPALLLETHVKPRALAFAPGTAWAYSNSNYLLLGLLLESLSGQDYGTVLRTRFLGPLGLDRTGYGQGASPGLAAGHLEDRRRAPEISTMQLFSAAGLVSTADDLGRWLRALGDGTALQAESFSRMAETWRFSGGLESGYGCGLHLRTSQGHRLAGHGGQLLGYAGYIEADLDADVQAVVLGNRFPPVVAPEFLTRRLLALAAGRPVVEPRPVVLGPGQLRRLAGRYQGRRPLRVVVRAGRLWALKGSERVELLPLSVSECLVKDTDTRFRFRLQGGAAAGLQVLEFGSPEGPPLPRVGDEPEPAVLRLPRAALEACAGAYEPGPGVRIHFRLEGGRLRCDDPDLGRVELEALGPDRFRVAGTEIQVEFLRSGGRVVAVATLAEERRQLARRVD